MGKFSNQIVRIVFIFTIIVLVIIPPSTSGSAKLSEEVRDEANKYFNSSSADDSTRRKRNSLFTPGNGNTNLEGLLASCQLTNLLMYQLLQQRPNLLLGGTGGGLLQSGSSGVGFHNILAPGGTPQLLTTYITTSTVSRKMTSTDVITIPLLFGNKPSPTTITRTKTYQVTSEELVTLTSTIRPSSTTQAILASATVEAPPFTPVLEDPKVLHNVKDYSPPNLNSIENQSEASIVQQPKPRPKRRKSRQHARGSKLADDDLSGNPSTERYAKFDELSSPAYAPFDYYKQPAYYEEPIVNYQEAFDTRRLKRRGEVEEAARPREYLLEPSYDNDASNEYAAINQCPQITVTKTITKFVNPPASVSSYQNRGTSRYDRSQQQLQQQPPQQQRVDEPQRRRDRGDIRRRVPPQTQQLQPEVSQQLRFEPTEPEITRERRVLLRNGRSRGRA